MRTVLILVVSAVAGYSAMAWVWNRAEAPPPAPSAASARRPAEPEPPPEPEPASEPEARRPLGGKPLVDDIRKDVQRSEKQADERLPEMPDGSPPPREREAPTPAAATEPPDSGPVSPELESEPEQSGSRGWLVGLLAGLLAFGGSWMLLNTIIPNRQPTHRR